LTVFGVNFKRGLQRNRLILLQVYNSFFNSGCWYTGLLFIPVYACQDGSLFLGLLVNIIIVTVIWFTGLFIIPKVTCHYLRYYW